MIFTVENLVRHRWDRFWTDRRTYRSNSQGVRVNCDTNGEAGACRKVSQSPAWVT